ncbi:MAG: TadE/TadG family type IV pilus assembly protein [Actinomycetes bacterium]
MTLAQPFPRMAHTDRHFSQLGDTNADGWGFMRIRASLRLRDDGASAVEFALILPLLVVLLFGIIDYGWWFGEALGLRSAVREAARLGAVNEVDPSPTSADAVRELMLERSPQLKGEDLAVAVRIYGPGATSAIPGVGSTLLICASFPGESITGLGHNLYPLPSVHVADTAMRLEKTPVLADDQTDNWTGTCSI